MELLMSNIRWVHKCSNLSKTEFAKRLNIPYKTVGAWFENRALPQTEHMEKISIALNISIEDLVRKDISKYKLDYLRYRYKQIRKFLTLP